MEHSSNLQNSQIPTSLPQPWTFEDNTFFQHVMVEVDHGSPTIYHDIARRMPWKSLEDIQHHYGLLIQELSYIHSGFYLQPTHQGREENNNLEESSTKQRRKYNRANTGKSPQWTNEEHQLFLMGLEQYGKGDWKSISMYCVPSKTPMQVASHAQKYFKRQNNPTPSNKRRYSIHDSLIDPTLFPPTDAESQIHQHNPPPPPQIIETQIPFSNPLELHPIPILNPCELPPNPNPNPNISNTGEGLLVGLPAENNSASTTSELSFLSDPLSNDWFLFEPPNLQLDLLDVLPQLQQSPTK